MSQKSEVNEVLDLVAKRIDMLRLLEANRIPKRTIVDELGYSRSTVNRSITALTDVGLVDDAPGGCRTTVAGSLLADQYDEYVETVSDVIQSREVLSSLSVTADLPACVLADADIATPSSPNSYEPFHQIEAVLQRPGPEGYIRVYVPTFSNPRGIELAQMLASELPVEIIFGSNLLAELRNDVPGDVEALFRLEQFTGFRNKDGPEYSIILTEDETDTEGAIVTHTADGELGGSIVTSNADATQWMEQRYAEIRAESDRLDDLFS